MRNLKNVYKYLEERDISFDICDTADSDHMSEDQVFVLGTYSGLSDKYTEGLQKTIEAQGMLFGYGDEFLIDYEDNKAYYLHDYTNVGYNFIIGDGYIIGENSDLESIDIESIVEAVIPQMDGNIGWLPSNGNIFERLVEDDSVHHVDFISYCNSWNKFDCKWYVEKMAKKFPNWYFIRHGNDFEVAIIKKEK